MARIEQGTGKIVEPVVDAASSSIKTGSIIKKNKPKFISIDQFTKIINSNLNELESVIKETGEQSFSATKISDIVAKHLGFDKSPRNDKPC